MFWFVCGKNWLLPALIQLEKVFCQFAEVYTNFYLILLKKGFVSFRLSYAVLSIMFLKTVFSFFSYLNCTLCPKKQQFSFSRENTLV